jgi:hypothetical protein
MMFPKRTYIRSRALLMQVASLECQHCGKHGETQAAHTNWGFGKGRGIKADDNMIAALCQTCHAKIDSGSKLSRAERMEMWEKAHLRTVKKLKLHNLWPIDVPLPEISHYAHR